ncbi:MAG TPA: 2-oxo acid dehydrogenase subunit E2 [Spirochaetes bacterium]|nr:2-oxo acid dehydrogenase subunit E2 [Spirochaetota bacterium]
MVNVEMPKLGLTMEEGKIIKWHKSEGDSVIKNEPLFEVETEKITSDVESPVSGVLTRIIVPAGSTVPVSELVAHIGETVEEEEVQIEEQMSAGQGMEKDRKKEMGIEAPQNRARTGVSPLALKIAESHNIDLSKIKGTGLGGMISKEDVLKIVGRDKKFPVEIAGVEILESIEMSLPRRKTAQRLSRMHLEAPHVTITSPVDCTKTAELRNRLKQEILKKTGKKLTYTHIFARAVTLALKEFPVINSRLLENKIFKIKDINLGIAVDIDEGLVVPVVKNAEKLKLTDLVVKMYELADKAASKKLTLDDITGGTFTISNLGTLDVDVFTPIINPPECAILGIGKMFKRAWVVSDKIEVRTVATFSLTFDHRIVDGAGAARFLKRIKEILENPGPFF